MLERGEKNWLIYQLKLEIQKTQNPLQTWGNQGCDSFHCIGVVSIDFFGSQIVCFRTMEYIFSI